MLARKWCAVLSVSGKKGRKKEVDLSYIHQSHLTCKTVTQLGREIIETNPNVPSSALTR